MKTRESSISSILEAERLVLKIRSPRLSIYWGGGGPIGLLTKPFKFKSPLSLTGDEESGHKRIPVGDRVVGEV